MSLCLAPEPNYEAIANDYEPCTLRGPLCGSLSPAADSGSSCESALEGEDVNMADRYELQRSICERCGSMVGLVWNLVFSRIRELSI